MKLILLLILINSCFGYPSFFTKKNQPSPPLFLNVTDAMQCRCFDTYSYVSTMIGHPLQQQEQMAHLHCAVFQDDDHQEDEEDEVTDGTSLKLKMYKWLLEKTSGNDSLAVMYPLWQADPVVKARTLVSIGATGLDTAYIRADLGLTGSDGHVDRSVNISPLMPFIYNSTTSSSGDSSGDSSEDLQLDYSLVFSNGQKSNISASVMIPRYLKYGVMYDIDDTLKQTQVLDMSKALRNLFFKEYVPVPGMPALVKHLQSILSSNYSSSPASTSPSAGGDNDNNSSSSTILGSPPLNFYVSGSVWQLIDPLREFIDRFYAQGELILQRFAMNPTTTLDLLDIPSYKQSRFTQLQSRFESVRWYLVGDSGQKDPETYAGLYSDFPDKIDCIWIVKTTGTDAKKEAVKNADARFDSAFHGVPRDRWFAFDDPRVVMELPPGQCRPSTS